MLGNIHFFRQGLAGLKSGGYFALYLLRRIRHDRLTVCAGSLAYVTLLSLVPLVTVVLTALSSSPVFAHLGELLQGFMLDNFMPAASEVVEEYLDQFVANAGKMTAVGIGALFVVAMMLISNIDGALNYIFRVKVKRRWVFSFSIYWMILTLGPFLVGSSLAMSSYLGSLNLSGYEFASDAMQRLLRLLPAIMSLLAFLGAYLLVPNTKVHFRHALIGALVATILFEFSKKAFSLYLGYFPTYQVIYGALAAVPILFVWVYLSWCIVLFGAELTASLGEAWQTDAKPSAQPTKANENQHPVLQATVEADTISEQQTEGNRHDSVDSTGQ